jgi:glycine cleavage system H protein
MDIPDDYLFTDEHEWARDEGDGTVTVGITEQAEDMLGDVVYVELPREGDSVEAGGEFGFIESVKAAEELFSPVSGDIVDVNESLLDAPEQVNESPYEDGWMVRVEADAPEELDELMGAEAYADFVQAESH